MGAMKVLYKATKRDNQIPIAFVGNSEMALPTKAFLIGSEKGRQGKYDETLIHNPSMNQFFFYSTELPIGKKTR